VLLHLLLLLLRHQRMGRCHPYHQRQLCGDGLPVDRSSALLLLLLHHLEQHQ
jgi:hypothetical protein